MDDKLLRSKSDELGYEKLLKSHLDELGFGWEDATKKGWESGVIIEGGMCDILVYFYDWGCSWYDLFQDGKTYESFSDEPQVGDRTSFGGTSETIYELLEELGMYYQYDLKNEKDE